MQDLPDLKMLYENLKAKRRSLSSGEKEKRYPEGLECFGLKQNLCERSGNQKPGSWPATIAPAEDSVIFVPVSFLSAHGEDEGFWEG